MWGYPYWLVFLYRSWQERWPFFQPRWSPFWYWQQCSRVAPCLKWNTICQQVLGNIVIWVFELWGKWLVALDEDLQCFVLAFFFSNNGMKIYWIVGLMMEMLAPSANLNGRRFSFVSMVFITWSDQFKLQKLIVSFFSFLKK